MFSTFVYFTIRFAIVLCTSFCTPSTDDGGEYIVPVTTINMDQEVQTVMADFTAYLKDIEDVEKRAEFRGKLQMLLKMSIKAARDAKVEVLELGALRERLSATKLLLKKLIACGQLQSKLDMIKNLCYDAQRGQTVRETWMNILRNSKESHAMQLRLRLKAHGLPYETFARYAEIFENDINFARHPEYHKTVSEKDVKDALETIQAEESLKIAVEVILLPFPYNTALEFEPNGPFSTFECVLLMKVPGGWEKDIEALKNAIKTLNDNEKSQIQAKPMTKGNQGKQFTGEVAMCFADHATAYKFWFESDPLLLRSKDGKHVRVGFRPILDDTKESLFPSTS